MDEIIKGRYNYNDILTHRQKIELCKRILENDRYIDIIDTQLDANAPKMEYPYPDLIAKRDNKTIAVECGGLSTETKIIDLLKRYDQVIHFYEHKGQLCFIVCDYKNDDIILNDERLKIETLRRDLESLKNKYSMVSRDLNYWQKLAYDMMYVQSNMASFFNIPSYNIDKFRQSIERFTKIIKMYDNLTIKTESRPDDRLEKI